MKLMIAFLKRFCAGKNGSWSTRRFGFLAAGLNYSAMSWACVLAGIFRDQTEFATDIVKLNAGVFCILALFVSSAGLSEVFGNLFKKNKK